MNYEIWKQKHGHKSVTRIDRENGEDAGWNKPEQWTEEQREFIATQLETRAASLYAAFCDDRDNNPDNRFKSHRIFTDELLAIAREVDAMAS